MAEETGEPAHWTGVAANHSVWWTWDAPTDGWTINPDYFADPFAVSPPTFLMTSAFWATGGNPMASLNIDLTRLLHGGQEFTFYGPPPRAGTKLTATGVVKDIYEKEGKRGGTMTFIEMATEFSDESGKVVAESKNVLIITGKAPTEDK